MRLLACAIGLVCVALIGFADSAHAQGKGKGGFARPSFAGGGGPGFSKGKSSGPSLAERGPTISRHVPNLDKHGWQTSDQAELAKWKQRQLDIETRNRDKRLAQASHLREIAERNGNANLAANADRMEAFANEHYARRVAHWESFGASPPPTNPQP